ncbi:MAG: GNAT family N-acetyltransferase [Proteobacteria bacterium]|nr:GNAT family N-acetyltransferase [Pseudomonadota bacterium]
MVGNGIVELTSEPQWREAFAVLATLRTSLEESEFLRRRESLQRDGYRLFGLIHEGKIVAVAGADLYPHVTKGRNCWVHDLATHPEQRSKGYGSRLMRYLESWAKEQGCARLCVHTRFEREDTQKFYEIKLGYPRTAVTYYREL